MQRTDWLIASILALLVLTAYVLSPIKTSFDSRWSLHTALSIIREGDTDLDEYLDLLNRNRFEGQIYAVREIDGHYYNFYPLGTPLCAVPFVAVLQYFSVPIFGSDLYDSFRDRIPEEVEQPIAAFYAALAALFIYVLARLVTQSRRAAIPAALIFAFCTSAWSTASRGLWQHGPSMLLLTLALIMLWRGTAQLSARRAGPAAAPQREPDWLVWSALPLALACAVRPLNWISALVFALYILRSKPAALPRFALLGLAAAAPFLAQAWRIYGSPFSGYSPGLYRDYQQNPLIGFAGTLISPSRGLFIYSPVLLLGFVGGMLKIRGGNWQWLDSCLLTILLLHWLAVSAFPVWWGGHSYGPRYFTDMLPLLIYFLLPALQRLLQPVGRRVILLRIVFVALTAISGWTHWRGAVNPEPYHWNGHPTDINHSPQRLWSLRDPQFLRGSQVKVRIKQLLGRDTPR